MSETPPKYRIDIDTTLPNPVCVGFESVDIGTEARIFRVVVEEFVREDDNTPILEAQIRALRNALTKLEALT